MEFTERHQKTLDETHEIVGGTAIILARMEVEQSAEREKVATLEGKIDGLPGIPGIDERLKDLTRFQRWNAAALAVGGSILGALSFLKGK